MVGDVRNACKARNINVRCEIYDGQFLNLIRYNAEPRTSDKTCIPTRVLQRGQEMEQGPVHQPPHQCGCPQ